jgi:hypothetical protein
LFFFLSSFSSFSVALHFVVSVIIFRSLSTLSPSHLVLRFQSLSTLWIFSSFIFAFGRSPLCRHCN